MNKENQHIEYKSGFNEEVIETLTAFANSKGGRVLVGVKGGAKDTVKDTVKNVIKGVMVFGGDFVKEQEAQQGTQQEAQQETNANVVRLLKIIRGESWTVADLMTPTIGLIKAKDRIASLLEVGTGFHPELAGRENIYMNGSIMGMSRAEITRKLDEIVEFAGVVRYINVPIPEVLDGRNIYEKADLEECGFGYYSFGR